MGFSVAFWNVENFYGKTQRAKRVAQHIRDLDPGNDGPDVIGFSEFKDKQHVRDLIMNHFKDYSFALTDTGGKHAIKKGQAEIELLVGWKPTSFDQVSYTQRVDLKGGRDSIRPGALLHVRQKKTWHSLLFLHTKSGPSKEAYAARVKTFRSLWRLKKRLVELDDTAHGLEGKRLIVLGDLNTMGDGNSVSGATEVRRLRTKAKAQGMFMPTKEYPSTFRKYYSASKIYESNLDHVLVSESVDLKALGRTPADSVWFKVAVRGWNQLLDSPAKLREFQKEYSDHSALFIAVD